MEKHSRKRSNRFLLPVLLIITCIIIIPCVLIHQLLTNKEPTDGSPSTLITLNTTATRPTETTPTTVPTTTAATTADTTATTATTANTTAKTTAKVTASYVSFPDTLFIGDSRTEGMSLYGKISDAIFFSKTSMSIFSLNKAEVDVKGIGTTTLSGLLAKKKFRTVYIMLGINELGSSPDSIASHYATLIDTLKSTQPDAAVIIQSTLHVTQAYSSSHTNFSASRVNTLNSKLKALADNKTVYFLDINPLFDDATGNLDPKYTSDGCHFYAKYYPMWRDFLKENPKVKLS